MILSIQKKLFLITVIPVLALSLLASLIAYKDYEFLLSNTKTISQMHILNDIVQLIHELQYERGLSNANDSKYFQEQLKKHRLNVDKNNRIFLNTKNKYISHLSVALFESAQKYAKQLPTLRKQIDAGIILHENSFFVYSTFITTLRELAKSLPLNVDDERISSYIQALQKILKLQEISAYKRGNVILLLSKDDINEKSRYAIRANTKAEREESKYIRIILDKTKYQKELRRIDRKYTQLNLNYLLLTPEEWFFKSSEKINAIHTVYEKLFQNIIVLLNQRTNNLRNRLLIEVFGTVGVILLLLLANLYVSNRITRSVKKLSIGLDEFFEYLHFKRELPKSLEIASRDEIYVMARSLNEQMIKIDEDLNDDADFIHEVTQIVLMMKEGDFSERPYFEPKNPNLIELKKVFLELIDLISDKIKEQTTSLERLNSSLEDKVYEQTLELHNQVETVTKARDEAIQAQVMKDEFLANMSHEIRTPLNGILGFVAILKKQLKNEKHLEYIRVIDESGKSLLTIINDILDFSKIQSGKFVIDKHPTAIVEAMSDTVLLFASKVYEKDLIYATFIDPKLPHLLNLDVTRIKQILSNLLSNAIKFTPDFGEVKVSVVYKNSHLLISVRDSGIGISKKNQEKVFSAFTQADGSTTRNYGGTGLGLSISSNLANLMGGTLTLVSEVGEGSTFTLNIPCAIIEEEPLELLDKSYFKNVRFAILSNCSLCTSQVKLIVNYFKAFGIENIIELHEYRNNGYDILLFTPEEEYNNEILEAKIPAIALLKTSSIKLANIEHIHALYAPFVPKDIVSAIEATGVQKLEKLETEESLEDEEIEFEGSVLIAEDNKTNQMLIKLLMMDYGIDFTLADDGVEAVAMFKKGKFDMVLMDENMPNMNGLEAMKQIKVYEQENNLASTPIIALTASALSTDKEMFLNEGMDGFIAKPIENKMLEAELEKYLQRV